MRLASPPTQKISLLRLHVWINDGPNSHADPDHLPVATSLAATSQMIFTLPKASITVLRGKVPGLKIEP